MDKNDSDIIDSTGDALYNKIVPIPWRNYKSYGLSEHSTVRLAIQI
jgi:hypothetical protein